MYEKFPEKFLDKKFGNSSRTRREENTIKFIRTIMKRGYANDVSEIELVPHKTLLVSKVKDKSISVIPLNQYIRYCLAANYSNPSYQECVRCGILEKTNTLYYHQYRQLSLSKQEKLVKSPSLFFYFPTNKLYR